MRLSVLLILVIGHQVIISPTISIGIVQKSLTVLRIQVLFFWLTNKINEYINFDPDPGDFRIRNAWSRSRIWPELYPLCRCLEPASSQRSFRSKNMVYVSAFYWDNIPKSWTSLLITKKCIKFLKLSNFFLINNLVKLSSGISTRLGWTRWKVSTRM